MSKVHVAPARWWTMRRGAVPAAGERVTAAEVVVMEAAGVDVSEAALPGALGWVAVGTERRRQCPELLGTSSVLTAAVLGPLHRRLESRCGLSCRCGSCRLSSRCGLSRRSRLSVSPGGTGLGASRDWKVQELP